MTNHVERVAAILAEAEAQAYARGWADAISAVTKAASAVTPVLAAPANGAGVETILGSMISDTPKTRGRRPGSAVKAIINAIHQQPGMRGVEIVAYLHGNGWVVGDKTVRSALRRLKGQEVWQRNHKWYPKHPRAGAEISVEEEQAIGEAVGSPPH
jgi:hypothetical protein